MEPMDSHDTKQSKQRASIKWLLSKAYNNRVPENLREPFYRDHEEQEHLKPPIIGALASAELYCQALANIYSDPNYHSLNHWNILQTLSRKGAPVADPPHCPLTETVLINTNPLKMNAHMAVIEAMMVLYAKEVVRWERVSAALSRFGSPPQGSSPTSTEEGLLAWVRGACTALAATGTGASSVLPSSLQELCDGAALVSLVRYYCGQDAVGPDSSSSETRRPRSLQESLTAARALRSFCRTHLPHDIFHMEPEDLTYMRGAMKQNLIVMLADLFNVLEIHPAKCVKYPNSEGAGSAVVQGVNAHGVAPRRCLPPPPPAAIPDLRDSASDLSAPFTVPRSPSATQVHTRGRGSVGSIHRSACSTPEYRSHTPPPLQHQIQHPEETFVVHRGKQVTTLSSLARQDEGGAAGRPSDWESRRGGTYAGRRSRRSSISDDSQLTVENFGGSQDQINFIGRNPEKELATVQSSSRSNTPARKISAPAGPIEQATPVRSSIRDARGSIQLFYDEPSNGAYGSDEKQQKSLDRQYSQPHSHIEQYEPIRRQLSSDTITLKQNYNNFTDRGGGDESFYLNNKDYPDGDVASPKMTFADLTKYRSNGDQAGIQLIYMQHGKEDLLHQQHQPKKKSLPPNQTTWQQLKMQHDTQANGGPPLMASDSVEEVVGGGGEARLAEVRLALEERRRRIEADKRKAEVAFDRQRRALGHHAFLQAVTKNKASVDSNSEETGEAESPSRPSTLQDIPPEGGERWMANDRPYVEPKRTPDYDGLGIEEYQHSIAKMNSNLQDIQNDIARLANQQNQIQASQIYQQHYHNAHNIPQLHNQYGSAHNVSGSPYAVNTFGSSPHIPDLHQQPRYSPHAPQVTHFSHPESSSQFYLHEQQPRRAWAAPLHTPTPPPTQQHTQPHSHSHSQTQHHIHHHMPDHEHNTWQAQTPHYHPQRVQYPEPPQRVWSSPSPQPTDDARAHGDGFQRSSPSPVPSSRYHNGAEQRISLQQLGEQQPARAPAPRDMEPQSISFIGNAEEDAPQAIARLNITSGSRTYRLPSPTRPSLARDSFEKPISEKDEKGFYVSFDDDRPKRTKPPLRSERSSPKKENAYANESTGEPLLMPVAPPRMQHHRQTEIRHEQEHKFSEFARDKNHEILREKLVKSPAPAALVVGDLEPEAEYAEEMERKKERIMMLSLQRRQRAESSRAAAEQQAAARRAADEAAAERRSARKEEQQRRRDAILQRHKLKKAIEEAEREGKVVDKAELAALCMGADMMAPPSGGIGSAGGGTAARLRGSAGPAGKRQQRPARPNTIHVDSGAVERATEGLLVGRSSNNLSGYTPTMRRDYYRGSQDSLADRAGLYKDSPVDDSRGMSPGSISGGLTGALGRRGSCKTSRERINEAEAPASVRGRSKYSTYQNNFKAGRKSTSLMNLCADSGLGRATPPRRAASPGVGGRTLPSPCGAPGSLPPAHLGSANALQRRMRTFDDASSDLSSTPSSMIDYSGPRLYKQPATKSNRGIMLNAVEYCVFPGAVNREAKRRVLEEIARSDAKHFLVLFRDAGCQFRALYEYCPERELVNKLYGTGPRSVNDRMFDKFFKYNSGSKCFSVVHTKHLTVTIDAFTIHNSLWQGKKVALPSKKDMALVI